MHAALRQAAAAECRVLAPAELNLHFSCRRRDAPARQGAARLVSEPCDSDYSWHVTLPLTVTRGDGGGNSAADAEADAPQLKTWAVTAPELPPLTVTLLGGAFDAAAALRDRFPVHARVACHVDASGTVASLGDNATAALALHAAQTAPDADVDAGPLALALLHAGWCVPRPRERRAVRVQWRDAPVAVCRRDATLSRVGAVPRPLPARLARLGWLPWARCCAPGAPLLALAVLSALARAAPQPRGGNLAGTCHALWP